jgi:hypothetical protein
MAIVAAIIGLLVGRRRLTLDRSYSILPAAP